jgi:hypothetical protein
VRVRLRLDDTDDSSSPESADSARRSDDRFILSSISESFSQSKG